MKRKKICLIIGEFAMGGVGRITASFANSLLDKQIAVTIIALTGNHTFARQWFDQRCRLLSFRLLSFRWSLLFALIPLWWHLLFHRYDAVISAGGSINVFTIIAHRMSFHHSKLIASTHIDLYAHVVVHSTIAKKIVAKLSSYLYRYADYQVAVSDGAAVSMEKVLHIPRKDVHTIYNPVARKELFTLHPDVPHKWMKEEIPVILGCGRLVEQKDFFLLIKAFAKVAQRRGVRLLILGEGELRENLQKSIEELGVDDRVLLVGEVSNPEAYMYHARLFVLSSLWEGFGNVVVEALAVGCPVVSMDCPSGPAEILEEGKWGRLVDNTNRTPEALANAIEEELDRERPSRAYLQQRARDFTPEKIVAEYLRLIYGE